MRRAKGLGSARVIGILTGAGLFLALTALPAYAVIPTVSSIWPSTANPGCQMTIVGTNFLTNGGPASAVTFGVTPATTFSIDADTQLEATVPAALPVSTAENIVVTNTTGPSAASLYTTGAAAGSCPGIPTFAPSSGAVGTSVTISGVFVTPPIYVRFNTTLAIPSSSTAAAVTVTVPAGATTGPVRVYTTAGAASSATSFTVSTVTVPTISSFSPANGPVGTSVVITGTGFTGATAVRFNGVASAFTANSDTQITATVPATATTGKISVTTAGGTATSVASFTVTGTSHSRTVSMSLSGSLRASGMVSVTGAFTPCAKNVPVAIQRQKLSGGRWRTLELLSTNTNGAFSGYLPNQHGRYRARVGQLTLLTGATCGGDISPVRRH